MADKSRISKSPGKFNAFITTTDDENTTTNPDTTNPWWQDLGITSTNKDDWHTKRGAWVTLYAKYMNPAIVNSTIRDQVHNFIRDFRTFANPLLDIMAASNNATEESEHIYHFVIKKNRKTPAHRKTKITENCYPSPKSIGGGEFLVPCRTAHDGSRPSVPVAVDGVMVWFKIVDTAPSSTTLATMVVDEKTWSSKFFSTARFVHDVGEENVGKWMLFATQWYYSPNGDFAGPVSTVQAVLIG